MKAKDDGISQGIEQEKINIAKKLLDLLDDETISLKTKLPIDFIPNQTLPAQFSSSFDTYFFFKKNNLKLILGLV